MLPSPTRVRFTKMQGAGNDFVVLDATRAPLALGAEQMRRLGDRRFGVGADQILIVERPTAPRHGFQLPHLQQQRRRGGALRQRRALLRPLRARPRHDRRATPSGCETVNNELELHIQPDGRVRVDMDAPRFEHADLPFDAAGLAPRASAISRPGRWAWPTAAASTSPCCRWATRTRSCGSRMSNTTRWRRIGPLVESHPRFARRVNAGFMQVLSRTQIRLRVHERDAGETLACGTGACAAVVAGIRLGWLDTRGRHRHARRQAHRGMGRRRAGQRVPHRPGDHRLRRRN